MALAVFVIMNINDNRIGRWLEIEETVSNRVVQTWFREPLKIDRTLINGYDFVIPSNEDSRPTLIVKTTDDGEDYKHVYNGKSLWSTEIDQLVVNVISQVSNTKIKGIFY